MYPYTSIRLQTCTKPCQLSGKVSGSMKIEVILEVWFFSSLRRCPPALTRRHSKSTRVKYDAQLLSRPDRQISRHNQLHRRLPVSRVRLRTHSARAIDPIRQGRFDVLSKILFFELQKQFSARSGHKDYCCSDKRCTARSSVQWSTGLFWRQNGLKVNDTRTSGTSSRNFVSRLEKKEGAN